MLDDASSPPPSASPAAETPSAGGSRLSASVDWLKGRADTSLGRLTLLWPGTARSFRARNGTFDPEPYGGGAPA